jgi:precorrin-2/cobalt-factor-2 C20-methyltransferase
LSGQLIGVGVGPGDPDLLTVRAIRALERADVVAYFAKAGNQSNARNTAQRYFRPEAIDLPLLYPVTTEHATATVEYRVPIQNFFDDAAARVAAHLDAGRVVAVLSEGDPLFFGSYMHIHVRLLKHYAVEVIPGITAMSACWSAAGIPIVQGENVLTVLPGTLDESELLRRLERGEPTVVMKVGRNLGKIRRAVVRADRLSNAVYVERVSMQQERVMPLADKADDDAPYFSMVLVSNPWGSS